MSYMTWRYSVHVYCWYGAKMHFKMASSDDQAHRCHSTMRFYGKNKEKC